MITVKGNLAAVKEYPPIEPMKPEDEDIDYEFSGYSETIRSDYVDRIYNEFLKDKD